MSIREQLANAGPAFTANGHAAIEFATSAASASGGYHQLKRDVHETVLDRVELERLARYPQEQVRQEIATLVNLIIDEQKVLLNENERRQLTVEIYDEMFGFGPLEPLLQDPTVSDILVNTA
ncbi:MAG: CpaF family protein, partial [Cupriavidus necator]